MHNFTKYLIPQPTAASRHGPTNRLQGDQHKGPARSEGPVQSRDLAEPNTTGPVDPLIAKLSPRKRFAERFAAGEIQPPPAKLAPPAPAESSHEENVSTLVDGVRASKWDSEAGDMAPQLITRLQEWPAGCGLEVHDGESGRIYAFGDMQPGGAVARVVRENEHYSALVGGQRVEVPGDGNCFFHAVAKALGWPDDEAGVGLDLRTKSVQSATVLRLGLARHIEMNPLEVEPWTVRKKAADHQPLQPAPATRALRALLPLPAVVQATEVSSTETVPKRETKLQKIVAALDELMEEAKRELHANPRRKPLDKERIQQCALAHGLEAHALNFRINLGGELLLQGRVAVQQREKELKPWEPYARIDDSVLGVLQRLAKHPDHPVTLSDKFIADYGEKHNLSIQQLRLSIDAQGNLKQSPKAAKNSSQNFESVTWQGLKKVKACVDRGSTLKEACEMTRIAFKSLRHLIGVDGILTPAGEDMVRVGEEGKDAAFQSL